MTLPDKWVDGLQKGEHKPRPVAELTSAEARAWMGERGAGEMCSHMEGLTAKATAWFAEHGEGGAYEHMNGLAWGLARDARDGHPGVAKAAKAIQRAYVAEVAKRRGGQKVAEEEWRRSLAGAVQKVAAEPDEPADIDPCEAYRIWEPTISSPDGSRSKLGRILTRADLASLPAPTPLIEGWVDCRTAVVVVGATGANKTFTIIGWACSVATGKPWLGNDVAVEPGRVILVVGEGAYGLNSRIAAWEEKNGIAVPPDALVTLVQPESINDNGFWRELTAFADEERTPLIALDTFSSLAPTADETKDAAKAIRHMSELSLVTEGAVILSLHTGWGPQDRARGGSQLEANPDGVIVLQKHDPGDSESPVSIRRKKNKEGRAGALIWVRREPVGDGESCVLEVCPEPEAATTGVSPEHRLLDVLEANPFVYNKTELRDLVGGKATAFGEAWDRVVPQLISQPPNTPGKRALVWGLNPNPRVKLARWDKRGNRNGDENTSAEEAS